jgi:hypothetical protein
MSDCLAGRLGSSMHTCETFLVKVYEAFAAHKTCHFDLESFMSDWEEEGKTEAREKLGRVARGRVDIVTVLV